VKPPAAGSNSTDEEAMEQVMNDVGGPNKDYWTRNVNSEIVEVNFNNFMVSWRKFKRFFRNFKNLIEISSLIC
jgi:hypothetical protein